MSATHNYNLKGYHYFITEEQVLQHRKRSFAEIIEWLHNANEFLNTFQSKEEKELTRKLRTGEI
jgi:hypothetical protein